MEKWRKRLDAEVEEMIARGWGEVSVKVFDKGKRIVISSKRDWPYQLSNNKKLDKP